MVARSDHLVVLISILQERYGEHFVQVILRNVLIILPRVALVVFPIRLGQHFAAPAVDLLALLHEAVVELGVHVNVAVISPVILEQLRLCLLLASLLHALVLAVLLHHLFELLLPIGFGVLDVRPLKVALVELLGLGKVL